MISDRLRARADRFAGNALRNEPFSPQECAAFAQELLAFADQVQIMENTWFAPEAITELADYLHAKRNAA